MLKIFKKIILIIFILVVFFIHNYVNASEIYNLRHENLSEAFTIKIGDLKFSSIEFKNFAEKSEIFGIAGTVQNLGTEELMVITTANFFTYDDILIATLEQNQIIPAGEVNSYSTVANINQIKNGYTADEIDYFTAQMEIKPYENKFTSSITSEIDDSYEGYNNDFDSEEISTNENTKETEYKKNSTSNSEYTISDYHIDMVVNENNSFDITETITAKFNVSKHGIFRKIPLRNSIKRIDGTTSNNKAIINNINVNEEFSTYTENGNKVIKIGNANRTLTGKKVYKIKYNYSIGKDPLKNEDELYFNLIGNEWDTTIDNVSFNIEMPKEFDMSTLGFALGEKGESNSSYVKYSVSGNNIIGSVNKTLNIGEGLTVRLTLPEGYFSDAKTNLDFFSIAVIVISVLFAIIGYSIWKKYGKDDAVIETVEFYPPNGFNSAEIGFIYDGCATENAIISLLIELANKGYLKIEEHEDFGLFSSKNSFKLIKLKEYDGNNENEKLFFNGLFKTTGESAANIEKAREIMNEAKIHGEKISFINALELSKTSGNAERNVVTAADLYNSFYLTMQRIKMNIESKENKAKIFETVGMGYAKWLISMIIAIFILITIKPISNTGDGINILPFALLFPGIGFTVLITMVFGKPKGNLTVMGKPTNSAIAHKIFGLVWGGMFGGMPWCMIVLPALLQDIQYVLTYAIGMVCITILLFVIMYLPKRTQYGNEMLGKIRGFKRFLETAEKEELERLVFQNPEYFYNILPYTYALRVSDIWISQFETIAIKAPDWYDSPNGFSMHSFGSFMSTTMTSAATCMSSSPSSSSGGDSGGGSSGGGSGGGGGGSW